MKRRIFLYFGKIMDYPKVSLHTFPPFASYYPSPAIGYLKCFIESQLPGIIIRAYHWNETIPTLCLSEEKFSIHVQFPNKKMEEYYYFFEAVFAYLFASRERYQRRHRQIMTMAEIIGTSCLADMPPEAFRRIVRRVDSYLESEIVAQHIYGDDIVGCSVHFGQLIPSLVFCHRIKKKKPTMLTVLGGMTKQAAEKIIAAFPFIDICIYGEGELPLTELCAHFSPGARPSRSVPCAVYQGRKVCTYPDKSFTRDASWVMANYDGFDWNLINDYIGLPILDSRGCPCGKCGFCDLNMLFSHYQERPAESVLGEIQHQLDIVKKHPRKAVVLIFLGNEARGSDRDRFIRILDGLRDIKKTESDLKIQIETSPRFAEEAIIARLNELDAYIQWGFETWSERLLRMMKKPHGIEHSIFALKLIERYPRIHVSGFNIILGYPGETLIHVQEATRTLNKIKFIMANLVRRGQLELEILSGAASCQITPASPIGKKFDFRDSRMREKLDQEPRFRYLSHMCRDKNQAREIFIHTTPFLNPRANIASKIASFAINRLFQTIPCSYMDAHRSVQEPLMHLVLTTEQEEKTIILEDLEVCLLQNTAGITTTDQLVDQLQGFANISQIKRSLKQLDENNLVYFTESKKRLINTLPHKIQLQIDRHAVKASR